MDYSEAMNAALAELQASSVVLPPDADEATILEHLRVLILEVVTAEPEAFDRPTYDHLVGLWTALNPDPTPPDSEVASL